MPKTTKTQLQFSDKGIRDYVATKATQEYFGDPLTPGLSVRVLPSGTKSFVLDYTKGTRRRVYTIGKTSQWTVTGARKEAIALQVRIRREGFDPAEALKSEREAPEVNDLCDRFEKEYLPKLRPATRLDYARIIKTDIRPSLGMRKVATIDHNTIHARFLEITKRASGAGNYFLSLSSRLFSLAMKWDWISKNPVKGIERNPTQSRIRRLTPNETAGLKAALDEHDDQDMADLFRVLLYTGARRGETQSATWSQINFETRIWTKPFTHTKQKREHSVHLRGPSLEVFVRRYAAAQAELREIAAQLKKTPPAERPALLARSKVIETYVFPAKKAYSKTPHVISVKKAWATICKAAGIVTTTEVVNLKTGKVRIVKKHSARIHDLRHNAASALVNSGVNIYDVMEQLGHSQISTTQKYAHLSNDTKGRTADALIAAIDGTSKPTPKKKPRRAA